MKDSQSRSWPVYIPLNAWHAPGCSGGPRPGPPDRLGSHSHVVVVAQEPPPEPPWATDRASPRSGIVRSPLTAQFCRRHNNLLLVDVMSPCACPSCLLAHPCTRPTILAFRMGLQPWKSLLETIPTHKSSTPLDLTLFLSQLSKRWLKE